MTNTCINIVVALMLAVKLSYGGDGISMPGSIDFELSNKIEKPIKENSPFLGATLSLDTIFYIDQNICQNEEIKTYQCGVILWDPLSFARNIDVLICPICEVKEELRPTRWKSGKKKHDMPRKLHGIRGTVFLVSRVYICTRSHQVLAHDVGIISQVQLLTGIRFTKLELLEDFITSLCLICRLV